MGHFSVKIYAPPGSTLSDNQHTANALKMLMDEGLVELQPTEALAFMIQAALQDAALTIANAPAGSQASVEAMAAFMFILDGIRRPDLN